MAQDAWNATSVEKNKQNLLEKDRREQVQILSMQEQTLILTELEKTNKQSAELVKMMLDFTKENTEHVKQIALLTKNNMKSANRQFWASIIVSTAALIIAFMQLFIN